MSRAVLLIVVMVATGIGSITQTPRIALSYFLQTIPTRTPTPGPQPPTDEPPPTKPPDDSKDPTPVPPTATHTPLPSATVFASPDPDPESTSDTCTDSPIVEANGTLNVRSGPGTDYTIIGRLGYLETRPIVGRSANTPWWLIQLSQDQQGWVIDELVTVKGYTGNVPIIPDPEIDSNTPTPGIPWDPTPHPDCPVRASPIPATLTATSTAVAATATLSPTATSESDNTPEPTATETPLAEVQVTPLSTAKVPSPDESDQAGSESDEAASIAFVATATPLDEEPPIADLTNYLPIAGIFLFAAGLVVAIVRRRR